MNLEGFKASDDVDLLCGYVKKPMGSTSMMQVLDPISTKLLECFNHLLEFVLSCAKDLGGRAV